MVYRFSLLLIGLTVFLPCTSAKPDKVVPPQGDETVTVVAEPKY